MCRCSGSGWMLLWALLWWWLDTTLLILSRWIRLPRLSGLRHLVTRGALSLWGGSARTLRRLRPRRNFFLAGLILLRLLHLARLREMFQLSWRALRMEPSESDGRKHRSGQ